MKNRKFTTLAVLSTTAVLTAVLPSIPAWIPGTVQTAFGASAGWVEEDGELRYRDSDGYYLTDTWKKKDGEWYYLGEDGRLTRSSMVDEYYVDADGKRVVNCWIGEDGEEWDDESPDTFWYYFGKDGKAVTSRWQVIDGKYYYFNEESHMQTGKIELDGFTYYLGEENDGVMKTGWIQLENESDDPDNELVWHYFDGNGRMVMNQIDRKIENHYYTFENGILQTGWYQLPASDSANATGTEGENNLASASNATDASATSVPQISSYQYYEEDGKRANGWYTIEGAPEISEEGELFKFYFKNGAPYYAQTGVQTFSVESRRYGFNTRGEMQTGLQEVTLEDGTTANFYFGEDGVMKTGRQSIYDEDLDETQSWFFYTDGGNKGQGVHGVRDNSVYRRGLRLDADRDLRYAPADLDGTLYLVNTSGAIQKASASTKSSSRPELGNGFKDFKDSNDKIWVVDRNGIIHQ